MTRTKYILYISILLLVFSSIVSAASDNTLQMPSPVRGWATTPDAARAWGQTILDWAAMLAGIVAIGSILIIYLKSKVAKSSGSITDQNSATKGMMTGVLEIILLVVALAWIYSIFWK